MPGRKPQNLTALLATGLVFAGAAGVVAAEEAADLPPVTVTGERLGQPVGALPGSVSLVDSHTIARATQGIALDEALAGVPGVFAQNRYNFSQDVRLSIRGFGARAPFGIRGIRVLLDDIPETLVDGQTQVDMIDPFALERMEVLRGPAGALYGNASGGVMRLYTRPGAPDGEFEVEQASGQHGLRRTGVRAGNQQGAWNWAASVSDFRLDGYRDHSEAERRNLNARARYDFDAHSSLTALFSYVDAPDTQDPGSLTREEVRQDRRQARPQSLQFDGGQSAEQGRLGLVYELQPDDRQRLELRGFYLQRSFDNRLPFENGGIVEFERDFGGGGFQYTRVDRIAGYDNQLVLGLDVERQRDDRQRYDNEDGDRGDLTLDQIESALGSGVFVRNVTALTPRWELSLGARFDDIEFEIEDRFLADGDDSGKRRFREASWFAGTGLMLAPSHRAFVNLGTSFETPTFTEFANPDGGGFNPDVEPEQAESLELGLRGSLADNLDYELIGFVVRVDDELVSFQLEPGGRDYFRNAGRSARDGVELAVDMSMGGSAWFRGMLSAGRFEFRQFAVDGEDFSGNRIPGLPQEQAFFEFGVGRDQPFMAAVNVHMTGHLYADDANETRVSGHSVVNARTAWRWVSGQWHVEPWAGLNNITDEQYNSNVRINQFGGRFFEPAPERNWHAGVNVGWRGQ